MTAASPYKLKNNPLLFANERTEALDEVFAQLLEALEEYATKKKLTDSEIADYKEQILKAYLEKKASYFLEDRITNCSNYLQKALGLALSKSSERKGQDNITKFFYYNNKHQMLGHEQS